MNAVIWRHILSKIQEDHNYSKENSHSCIKCIQCCIKSRITSYQIRGGYDANLLPNKIMFRNHCPTLLCCLYVHTQRVTSHVKIMFRNHCPTRLCCLYVHTQGVTIHVWARVTPCIKVINASAVFWLILELKGLPWGHMRHPTSGQVCVKLALNTWLCWWLCAQPSGQCPSETGHWQARLQAHISDPFQTAEPVDSS